MVKKKVTLSIEKEVYNNFQRYCEDNAILLSKKIELVMKDLSKKSKSIGILFMVFGLCVLLSGIAGATQIATDNFECAGFNCGNGWAGSWSFSGTCEITTLGGPIGTYHMRGQEGCLIDRAFGNSAYATSNVSFWATAQSLEDGDFCYYYYFNGTDYIQLLSLTNGDDDTTHDYYEFNVDQYGLSSGAKIRVQSPSAGADYCAIDNVNITGSPIITSAPSFSNHTSFPSNGSEYIQGQFYQFNVTINETNPAKAGIEFNGINYTNNDITNYSDIFIFNISDLGAGTYEYYWWANNTNGIYNTSEMRHFTINKASQSITPLLNGINNNLIITFPQQVNASYSGINKTSLIIKINETQVNAGQNYTFGAGSWLVNYSMQGSQNYTLFESYLNLTINKASGNISLLLNGIESNLTIQYPQQANASAYSSSGAISLYRDGNDITSENANNKTLGAGYYNYSAFSSGSQNYTTASKTLWANITRTANPLYLLLNGISNNVSIIYGQEINASAYGSQIKIFRNGIDVSSENSLNKTLGAGEYDYFVNASGSQNYTENSTGLLMRVQVNKSSPYSSGKMTITITPSEEVIYPVSSTSTTISETNAGDSDINYSLYRNGILASQPDILTNPNAGTYQYEFRAGGGQNYTFGSVWKNLTVNKSANSVNLTLNNNADNISITYGTSINASVYSSSGVTSLYRNNISIDGENGIDIILGGGNYQYFANSSGNTNYIENSTGKIFFAVINQANSASALEINSSRSNASIYSGTNILLNASAITGQGRIKLYLNGTIIGEGYGSATNLTLFASSGLYSVTSEFQSNQNYTSSNETWWINVSDAPDTIPPAISITSPNGAYGYNTSIPLNYSATDANLESCWYSVDNSANISLPSCINSTLNISEGSHTIKVYANDTSGNEGNDQKSFSVTVGAPSINSIFPSNSYTNNQEVTFTYQATDIDLQSCELWGNFTGVFERNQTNNSIVSGNNEAFYLNLSEGAYTWNIKCIDLQNHSSTSENRTITIDKTSPQIVIGEPAGAKTSRNNIQITFTASDLNIDSCWFNVFSGSTEIRNNTFLNCTSGTSNFNVTIDADFIFNLYVNDSAGNTNSSSSSFSVSTSSGSGGGGGGGSSGGGGGGGTFTSNRSGTISLANNALSIKDISDIVLRPGENKKLTLSIKNIGTQFLNNCKIKGFGKYASWISADKNIKLGGGESSEQIFSISTPQNISSGKYVLTVGIVCDESERQKTFSVEILEKKIEFKINEVQMEKNEMKVNYSLSELFGIEQDINMQFILFDSENNEVLEFSDTQKLSPGESRSFEKTVQSASLLEGNYNLLVNLNSNTYSAFIQEKVFIGKTLSGLAILTSGNNISAIVTYGLMILFVVFIFLMFLRINHFRKHIKIAKSVKIRTVNIK